MALQTRDSNDQNDSGSCSDESIGAIGGYTYDDEASTATDSSDEDGSGVTLDTVSDAGSTSLSKGHSEQKERTKSTRPRAKDLKHLASVQSSQLLYPKSQYQNYVPPLPVCSERYAVQDLLRELGLPDLGEAKSRRRQSVRGEFVEFELSNFVIYLPDNRHHPYELCPLQDLASKQASNVFLFDGILQAGGVKRYVQAVPFDLCSIGNYGEDIHDVGDNVWIRSTFLANSEIYYRLKSAGPEYARFYHGFQWLANLAKHFVDYCQWAVEQGRKVSVFDFRTDFARWLQKTHGASESFQSWYQEYQGDDFRHAVAVNIRFLFKESLGVDESLRSLQIWSELLEKDIVPVQELKEQKTIVTPYIYDCFEHLRFGHLLKSVAPTHAPRKSDTKVPNKLKRSSGIDETPSLPPRQNIPVGPEREDMIKTIRIGDVISVTKDGEDSVWKDETTRWKTADDCWYIYVQGVHESKKGKLSFDGLWLYKSSDTCCAKMKYPFPNELFLSDNCTCSHGRIGEDDVLDRVVIEWYGSPKSSQERLFVRQTYLENDKFESLKEDHTTCQHLHPKIDSITPEQKYPIGQTVLATSPERRKRKHSLDPFEVVAYAEDGPRTLVKLRRLLRRGDVQEKVNCRPNELVYSDWVYEMDAKKIECKCLVRFYTEEDVAACSIPTPYDRDGAGGAFYITTRLVERDGYEKLEPIQDDIPRTLIQGFDPARDVPSKLLRGLDLYCGGGNFGRGLEEGSAMHNEWAVDYAKTPIHSYYANMKDPSSTRLFCGSVDDQLLQALQGNPKRSKLIPMVGEVDFISAGSPCQGFSSLNTLKNNDKGLKNQSLVASVAAYIDFYRPKYGLLENVMTMAQKGLGRDEDVLSQLICAIVGMGYQLQLFVLDAWSTGSPQSRSRLFVSFAAPDLPTLEHPHISHSHPAHTTYRGLGRLANGESFGHRIHCPTPFPYVTAYEATKDLPDIGDGQTFQCISHPDHILSIRPTTTLSSQMAVIPTRPLGSNFVSAWNEGHGAMTELQRSMFPTVAASGKPRQCVQKGSNAWGRVHPHRLFPTIVVKIYPMDARMGTCMHWDQQRMLTVMEARRAQSFPDHEVLVGSTADKWKVIGNSVSRTVSLALGLSLRNAWLKHCGEDPTIIKTTTTLSIPSTPSTIKETVQAQPNILRSEPILPTRRQTPKESNVGKPLEPLLRSAVPRPAEVAPTFRGHKISLVGLSKTVKTKVPLPLKTLKRRHSTFQEKRVLPPEASNKTHNGYSTASNTSTPYTDTSRAGNTVTSREQDSTHHALGIAALHRRLGAVLDEQIARQRKSLGDTPGNYDDQDGEDAAVLNSVTSKLEMRFSSRTTTPQTTRTLGKGELRARLVIDVDSSSEDGRSTGSDSTGQRRILPPPPKYIRTSKGRFAASPKMNGLVHGRNGA